MKSIVFTCFLFVIINVVSNAQPYQLYVYRIDSTMGTSFPLFQYTYKTEFELIDQIKKWAPALQNEGYLTASIDSIHIAESEHRIYYHQGKKYLWVNLNLDSIPPNILYSLNINKLVFENKPIKPSQISKLITSILSYLENNGYPFAKIWFSDIKELGDDKTTLRAILSIDKMKQRKIDTLMLQSNTPISNTFIQRYLDISKGSLYNEAKLKKISGRLKELSFIQESEPWNILFKPSYTQLNLFLKEKKANRIDALIGLMPNNIQTKKMMITADVQLGLNNFLGKGETINASYQNLQVKSPRISADVMFPYIAGSSLSFDGHFNFYNYQLLFRKVNSQIGLKHQLNIYEAVTLYYHTMSNRVLSIDTGQLLLTKKLPSIIDSKTMGLGVNFESNHTDYKYNPHHGWQGSINLVSAKRQILKNNAIVGLKDNSGFDYSTLYDTLQLNTFQHQLSADIAYYIPLNNSIIIKTAYKGFVVIAPQLFQNELQQIGGFRVLRGFDEQSLYTYFLPMHYLKINKQMNFEQILI